MHAEEIGRLKERLFWRQGIDEKTGKRPETLALSGRRQVKNGLHGKEMQAADDFETKHQAIVQARADELHELNPRWTNKRIQKELTKEFEFSASTFKRHLVNPIKKKGS